MNSWDDFAVLTLLLVGLGTSIFSVIKCPYWPLKIIFAAMAAVIVSIFMDMIDAPFPF